MHYRLCVYVCVIRLYLSTQNTRPSETDDIIGSWTTPRVLVTYSNTKMMPIEYFEEYK
jgi:hypothetical protein